MRNHHFLLVCFPSQGSINPSLELAKRLTSLNVEVTFATTVAASRRMNKSQQTSTKTPAAAALSFATFSDGFDDENHKPNGDFNHYFSELKRCGSQSLTNLITTSSSRRRPFTFLIYTLLLNWAADVATAFDIPSALFSAQPATVLALYYYYFHGYGDTICRQLEDPSWVIELPGLPLLFSSRDMPSFFSPSGSHAFIIPPMREQMEFLSRQSQPKVLVNTFDALEGEALRAIIENNNDDVQLKMVGVGPLIPSSDELGGDLFQFSNEDYIGWLNSKAKSSVVYVSFGSICVLSEEQEAEILHALLESGHPFLWVMRSNNKEKFSKQIVEEERGKIVTWCRQIEVLKHPSLGCFVTHCGWNSTLESLSFGLPMVAFPQQIDQATNAKLVEDLWKIGVRVKSNNTEGIVEREEIRRCLHLVMDSNCKEGRRKEIVNNVNKWKELARQAISDGGSSNCSLHSFVAEIDEALPLPNSVCP